MKLPFKLPHKIEHRNRIMGFLIGLGLAAIFAIVYLSGILKSAENFDLDFKFVMRQRIHRIPVNKDIIFVDIDDDTLKRENTFPDDPRFYINIINKLGKNVSGKHDSSKKDVSSLGMALTFDYSNSYGRKIVPELSDEFAGYIDTIQGFVGETLTFKQDVLSNLQDLDNYLAQPDGPSMAGDIAARLDGMVYDTTYQTISDRNSAIIDFIKKTDLNALFEDREKNVGAAAGAAGNIYYQYETKSMLPTKYSLDNLRNDPETRKLFEKILQSSLKNRPLDPREGLVFDAYQNLTPKEIEILLKTGAHSFKAEARARLERDLDERLRDFNEFLRQNSKFAFKMPKEVENSYVRLRSIKPLHPKLGATAAGQGAGRAEFSQSDGTLRMIAPALNYNGALYPHLDLLLAMRYLKVDPKDVVFKRDQIIMKNATNPRTHKKKDLVIPLIDNSAMLINWAGIWSDTTTFNHINLYNLFDSIRKLRGYELYQKFVSLRTDEDKSNFVNGLDSNDTREFGYTRDADEYDKMSAAQKRAYIEENAPGVSCEMIDTYLSDNYVSKEKAAEFKKVIDDLKGKILLLGRTAVGTAEINPIPLEPRYHYVGLHANAINTIVQGLFVRQLSKGLVVLIFFVLGASLGFIGGFVHTKSSVITAIINFIIMIVVGAVYFIVCLYIFANANLNIPALIPAALIVVTFLLVFLYRFFTEEREKNKMKGMFATYVNKEVVDSLIADPDKLRLGGEWVDCTVFFSDVAGFTSISESLTAEALVDLLNEYLTAMTDIVFQYGGTLDKYIGDAIVAIYGAPIYFENHALNACYGALDMQVKLAEMRAVWKEQGRHELQARCGVNTGKMIAGNMGSKTRFNYTVMGSECELGEHMESSGKLYGQYITISEPTRKQCGDNIIVRWVDILDHGEHPIRIYELVAKASDGISDEHRKGIEVFEEGILLFFKREWDAAIEKFNEVYKHIPDDGPAKAAIKRCKEMIAEPPGSEFDELLASISQPH